MKKTMDIAPAMEQAMMKSADELIQMLEDLKREAALPISCSQASAVSDSWNIDNNVLMDACEANANFDWKFDECDEFIKNKDDLLDFTFDATNLAFASSVALSPPTSPHAKHNTDSMEQIDTIQEDVSEVENVEFSEIENECNLIIKDIFEPEVEDISEQRKIEEIEQWLLMAESSQGNEFLSQDPVTKEANEVEPSSTVCEVEVVEPQTPDVIIEPDVTQIVALPAEVEDESPVVETRSRRKRSLDYRDVSSPEPEPTRRRRSVGKGEKKRDQNKEAAKRYRDRKKKETAIYKQQCDKLEKESREFRERINDMLKERKVYLDLWKGLATTKSNPNFKIFFPDWM